MLSGVLKNKNATDSLSGVLKDVNEHPMVRHQPAEALGSIVGLILSVSVLRDDCSSYFRTIYYNLFIWSI